MEESVRETAWLLTPIAASYQSREHRTRSSWQIPRRLVLNSQGSEVHRVNCWLTGLHLSPRNPISQFYWQVSEARPVQRPHLSLPNGTGSGLDLWFRWWLCLSSMSARDVSWLSAV